MTEKTENQAQKKPTRIEGATADAEAAATAAEAPETAKRPEGLSVAERRRLRRKEEADKRKAEKASASAAEAKAESGAVKSADASTADAEEELDEQHYREARIKHVAEQRAKGRNPFPHKFQVTISLPEFVTKYQNLEAGDRDEDAQVAVAGRVMRLAGSGAKLRFYDLVADDVKIQLFADAQTHAAGAEDFLEVHNRVRRGDIVGVKGFPGKSKRGELSVFPVEFIILTPCLQMLPRAHYGLKDQEIRYRQRYLDLLINPRVKQTFITRSKIVNYIRSWLTKQDFVEVETPMMNLIPGGATARPFITHHNELDQDLYMRIAPELFLKMLVVGGMDRVFEMGKNFRNEGIDLTHNPEFTSMEFYMAYADYDDIQRMTEEMLSGLVKELTGGYTVKYVPDPSTGKEVIIDFTPPFKRVSYVDEIERLAGEKLPRPLDGSEACDTMKRIIEREKLDMPHPATATKLIDTLCGHYIEDHIVSPTFIKDYPAFTSPLAKWHRDSADYVERCELFVLGKEMANFYTELNDSITQRERFEQQARDKAAGDDEAQFFDEGFCTALEYGLPPTGGFGIGIDRLTMFLTNNVNIKEVILFPAMRPQQQFQTPASPPPTKIQ